MAVSVDGKVVSTIAVTSTSWTDYTVPITTSAGTHTVSVAYTNDLRVNASKDRNLRIDKITVVAAAVTTQTPAYFPTADWLWKPIAANPTIAANSATWVGYLSAPGTQHIADLYAYGVTLIPASAITGSTPHYDVTLTKAWGSDPFGSYKVAIPRGTKIPPGTDGQIAVLDPTSGEVFGIWQAHYDSATDTWSGSWGGMTPINGNGIDQTGQLDPSINVDAIPGITPGEKVIAKTLQTYGAYVVDSGSSRMAFAFEAVPDATSTNPGAVYTNAGLSWDYYDMSHIPWSQLRVIAA